MFALSLASPSLPHQRFKRREYKMERNAGVEDLYPPRESAVSPRNNTGKEKRASGHKRGERIRGERG